MPRLDPVHPDNTPQGSAPLLSAVLKKLGRVPNLVQALAHSPAALKFYLGQTEALSAGVLDAKLREQIALAAAGVNGCDYCASVHTLAGKGRGVSGSELAANLRGVSLDAKTQVALDFTRHILETRGHVVESSLTALKDAGFGQAEIVEIIAHVGMNIFTNYFSHVAQTPIDFPFVSAATAR